MNIIILIFIIYIIYSFIKLTFPKKKKRRLTFKKLYGLDQRQSIKEFERKMAKGMIRENKEVWVTAFCLNKEILSVTATICNKSTAHPSDGYFSWLRRADRLGGNEIRFYHNHPNGLGKSFFSSLDKKTDKDLIKAFKNTEIKVRNFLVYPTIFGFRIKENKSGLFRFF